MRSKPHDSEYARAVRAAIRARLRGKSTRAEYWSALEHAAAVHDRPAELRRWREERERCESD